MDLIEAVHKLDIIKITKLLKQKADVNIKDNNNNTPLHFVSSNYLYNNANIKIAKLLLDNEADVNCKNINGDTPLHIAVTFKNTEGIKLLLENDADIYCKNNNGNTPLHLAATCYKIEVVKLLLKHGADINIRNNNNDTPLDIVRKIYSKDIEQLLIKNGAVGKKDSIHIIPNFLNNYYKSVIESEKIPHIKFNSVIDRKYYPVPKSIIQYLDPLRVITKNCTLDIVDMQEKFEAIKFVINYIMINKFVIDEFTHFDMECIYDIYNLCNMWLLDKTILETIRVYVIENYKKLLNRDVNNIITIANMDININLHMVIYLYNLDWSHVNPNIFRCKQLQTLPFLNKFFKIVKKNEGMDDVIIEMINKLKWGDFSLNKDFILNYYEELVDIVGISDKIGYNALSQYKSNDSMDDVIIEMINKQKSRDFSVNIDFMLNHYEELVNIECISDINSYKDFSQYETKLNQMYTDLRYIYVKEYKKYKVKILGKIYQCYPRYNSVFVHVYNEIDISKKIFISCDKDDKFYEIVTMVQYDKHVSKVTNRDVSIVFKDTSCYSLSNAILYELHEMV